VVSVLVNIPAFEALLAEAERRDRHHLRLQI
jgi:hypothetical protein